MLDRADCVFCTSNCAMIRVEGPGQRTIENNVVIGRTDLSGKAQRSRFRQCQGIKVAAGRVGDWKSRVSSDVIGGMFAAYQRRPDLRIRKGLVKEIVLGGEAASQVLPTKADIDCDVVSK